MALDDKHADTIGAASVPEKDIGTVKDLDDTLDDAAKFLAEAGTRPPLTPEQEKKLVRKLDRYMIPLVSV